MKRLASVLAPISLALLSSALAGCAGAGEERAPEPVTVVAQPPLMLPEQLRIEAIGSARAQTSAQLFPETAGVVEAVRFEAGDYVRAGAPLVLLDSRRERLAVELAQVQVREAAQLLARYRRIEDTGAISESQIEAGETALASARVRLEQARTALADRAVRAPFSGHVGITEVDRGDRIGPDTPIAQIDKRSTLFVDFPAPEEAFQHLRPGQIVSVTPFSEPGREIQARIVTVDPRISPNQRSYIVRTAIDNGSDRLRPGMSFRIVFTGMGAARPAVPEEAIVWGGEGAYLWAVRDGKSVRVPATIRSRRDGLALIDAALLRTDRVIVEGVQKVRQGQQVRLVQPMRMPPQRVRLEPAGAAASDAAGNVAR